MSALHVFAAAASLLVAGSTVATPGVEESEGRPAPVFEPAILGPKTAAEAERLGLPFGPAAQDCRAAFPLTRRNVTLTTRLRERLVAAGHGRALREKQLAVSVVDLSPRTRIHYAGLNDDEMVYAASLPKIVAVLAVVQAAKEGRVKWTPKLAATASAAINRSSNRAATQLVQAATVPYIEEVMRRPGYCFYGDAHGGLWLGRGFGGKTGTSRDPVANSVHGATSRQVARFYTLLDKGLLVGPVGNQRIRDAMGPPELNHKFVRALGDEGAKVLARKSGTWRSFHSDSALVEHGDARYIVVALTHLKQGERVLGDVARIVDTLIVEGAHRTAASGAPAPGASPAPRQP